MFSRSDRRELAVLGLVALAWGLLLAPLVHSFTHAAGHRHTHGIPSTNGPHAAQGSVEHLLALATETPPAGEPLRMAVVLELAEREAPRSPALARWTPVEQPQGP